MVNSFLGTCNVCTSLGACCCYHVSFILPVKSTLLRFAHSCISWQVSSTQHHISHIQPYTPMAVLSPSHLAQTTYSWSVTGVWSTCDCDNSSLPGESNPTPTHFITLHYIMHFFCYHLLVNCKFHFNFFAKTLASTSHKVCKPHSLS